MEMSQVFNDLPAGKNIGDMRRTALYTLLLPCMFANTSSFADVGSAAAPSAPALVQFREELLRVPVDVQMFAAGNPVPAGTYRVELHVNGEWKGNTDVRFEAPGEGSLVALPCFDAALLETAGFELSNASPVLQKAIQEGTQVCRPLEELIEGAKAQYDHTEFRLNMAVPQALLKREAHGYVDPSLWDNGITAGILQYDYNAYRTEYAGAGQTSQYLGLRAGFNLGAWRLRYRASANHQSGGDLRYRNDVLYVERALPKLRSRLTVGDTYTDGQVFEALSFRGAMLDSDDRMYPDSRRGYAPVVRGTAQSNAKVEVSQGGVPIYEITVPPGPFLIDDLYPNGTSGDLLVTVTEADGSQNQFTVAYSAVAELLRPGFTKYSLVAGQYRNPRLESEPSFVMGTLRHGFNNTMTGYTGLMAAEGYQALSAGVALNLPIGAVATDITHAYTHLREVPGTGQPQRSRGHSVQLSYSKVLPLLDTNVTVASYRYSSNGFYSPSEAFQLHSGTGSGLWWLGERRRNRLVVNAHQSLPGSWGYFSISASSQDYWDRDERDSQYQATYGRSLRRLSFNVSASRLRNSWLGRWDNQYTFNLSVPMDVGGSFMHLGSTYTHNGNTDAMQANLSGALGDDHQFSYGLFAGAMDVDGNRHAQRNAGGNVSWTGSKARVGASASAATGSSRQYGVSLSGGVVAFGGGVIMASQLGDTIGIVEAKSAGGAKVTNASSVKLNRRGQAVVPWLLPYRQNSVALDPKGLSTDVSLATTMKQIAPTAGAVSLVRFETDFGYSILLSGRRSDGSYLPFAAGIFDEQGENVGYVSQGGQALVRVSALNGELTVRWGQSENESCRLSYSVPDDDPKKAKAGGNKEFRRVDVVCVQPQIEASIRKPATHGMVATAAVASR